jgi:hypothetical protein
MTGAERVSFDFVVQDHIAAKRRCKRSQVSECDALRRNNTDDGYPYADANRKSSAN